MSSAARPTSLDEEVDERLADDAAFHQLVGRLSRQSVEKHFDAYADIAWDDPSFAIDHDDPRWALTGTDPLGATDWYRSLDPGVQSRIGLYRIASSMKTGLQFENILKRGLFEYAIGLPNGAPEFRYAYHEAIEEAHHGLMFQEFVNRTGLNIKGLPRHMRDGARWVVLLGRAFPELFFFFVLGGEDPIDHVQRQTLRSEKELHPLLERIMRIHVTEEARHLSFARHYLKTNVPRLGWVKRQILAVAVPLILGQMAALMLAPSKSLIRKFQIPPEVIEAAYTTDPTVRLETQASLRKVRTLATELGLVTPVGKRIWKAFHIWPEAA
jgi:hypothetical protein